MGYNICLRGRKFRRLIKAVYLILLILLSLKLLGNTPLHHKPASDMHAGFPASHVGTCREQRNIVFIKIFKCASSTLVSMFNRFGYVRNLTFVLPVENKIYLGWPYQLQDGYFRPRKRGYSVFNMLTGHSVYTQHILEELMPEDTVYITSIREPYSHFKSTFHYYEIQKIAGVPGQDPITTYLRHIDRYEAVYQSPSARWRYCVPDNFTMTRNLMSFCLGFPLGFPPGTDDISHNEAKIDSYLEKLSKRFKIVLIVEYFIESVVLMRRYLCWSVKYVLYYTHNVGNYTYKRKRSHENFKMYNKRSKIDFKLYDHFNKTLWKQISKQDMNFYVEVNYFKDILIQTYQFCNSRKIRLVVPPSVWNRMFIITQTDCSYMKQDNMLLLKQRYDSLPPPRDVEKPSREFC